MSQEGPLCFICESSDAKASLSGADLGNKVQIDSVNKVCFNMKRLDFSPST
jgi:hypothetical protein